jgi:hypothetical protein
MAMRQCLILIPLLVGCEARFIDQRPASERIFVYPADLAAEPTDLNGLDLAEGDRPLAQGMFMNRAGHAGSGAATLYRVQGKIELRFAADFSVSGVPGPAVFLTSRESMGGSIDTQADVGLGTLQAIGGAQSYPVPAGAELGRRNVFVYCQPFRVEVAKANLVDLP